MPRTRSSSRGKTHVSLPARRTRSGRLLEAPVVEEFEVDEPIEEAEASEEERQEEEEADVEEQYVEEEDDQPEDDQPEDEEEFQPDPLAAATPQRTTYAFESKSHVRSPTFTPKELRSGLSGSATPIQVQARNDAHVYGLFCQNKGIQKQKAEAEQVTLSRMSKQHVNVPTASSAPPSDPVVYTSQISDTTQGVPQKNQEIDTIFGLHKYIVLGGVLLLFVLAAFTILPGIIFPSAVGQLTQDQVDHLQAQLEDHQVNVLLPQLKKLVDDYVSQHSAGQTFELSEDQKSELQKLVEETTMPPDASKEVVALWFNDIVAKYETSKDVFNEIQVQVNKAADGMRDDITAELKEGLAQADAKINKVSAAADKLRDDARKLKEEQENGNNLDEQELLVLIKPEIDRKIALYHADQTNETDFALFSAGGRVIKSSQTSRKTSTDSIKAIFDSFFTAYMPTRPPHTMLIDDTQVGHCWPMQSNTGWAVIELRTSVIVKSVVYEHVPSGISPGGSLSAPKHMKVWGLSGEPDPNEDFPRVALLADFEYNADHSVEKPLQKFVTMNPNKSHYKFVAIEVLDNHGADYTCMYRFRVHGDPVPKLS